jgi:hypothetical protein
MKLHTRGSDCLRKRTNGHKAHGHFSTSLHLVIILDYNVSRRQDNAYYNTIERHNINKLPIICFILKSWHYIQPALPYPEKLQFQLRNE